MYQTNGFNYTPGAGTNRVVLVMLTAESTTTPVANVGSVTLGGQTVTAIENADGVVVGAAGGFHNLIWLGYLDESRIASMSGSALSISWDMTPNQADGGEVKVQAATYQNGNQGTPIADSASNTNTSTSTIQAGNVGVGEGDKVIYGTVHGNVQNHTEPAGYTEQIEQDGPGSDHSNASVERDATTAGTENPTATWSSSWRTAIISAVLNESCYVESFQSWSATSADAWQTQNLSGAPYNVPPGAVVEVAVRNIDQDDELWGGVRAVGSGLERRFLLHEAESGGVDVVVMHVATDASSQIQHYADTTAEVNFVLLGYWACGTYVERFDTFAKGGGAEWTDKDLCSYGVRPGWVSEIVMSNKAAANERIAGVRTNGSALERRVTIHEAESGGVDTVTMFVKADTNVAATIEAYADVDADIDFTLVGYWSVAPLAYTELLADVGKPSANATWEDKDLTAFGVPDSAVAEFDLAHRYPLDENQIGVRTNGSSLARLLNLHEAECAGIAACAGDFGRMHVLTDYTAKMEFFYDVVAEDYTFHLIGYWDTCDTSVSYTVTDLGAITSSKLSFGYHINASEQLAGFEEDSSGNPVAWYLSSCGAFTSLGTLGGSYAEAHGINSAGTLAGWAHIASGERRAFTWTSGGGMVNLGTVSGRPDSEAVSINANGEVVGTVLDFGVPPASRLAFLYLPSAAYTLSAGMNSLGTLGGNESVATDINDSGQVVGGAQNASNYFRPFRWANGTMTDLGTLGGSSGSVDHRGEAINSSGKVVGRSYTAGGNKRAFYYDGSTMTDLGVLTGGTHSWASGINDSNVVVGTSDVTGGVFRAFVWDSTNGMRNLNNLIPTGTGWTLIRATDINNDGFITGFGTNGSGNTRAFLLTPTCNAGGGGAAFATSLANGSGESDEDGWFEVTIVDGEGGPPLAAIQLSTFEPGIRIDYQLFEPPPSEDPATPRTNPSTREGFDEGLALDRTLSVATTTIQPGSSVLISMTVTLDEVAELAVTPEDLQLHVFSVAADELGATWVPAGKPIGEKAPTMIVGESGFLVNPDGTVDYWAVRGAGGVFAVGKPAARDEPNTAPTVPARGVCGLGMVSSLLLSTLFVLFLRLIRYF